MAIEWANRPESDATQPKLPKKPLLYALSEEAEAVRAAKRVVEARRDAADFPAEIESAYAGPIIDAAKRRLEKRVEKRQNGLRRVLHSQDRPIRDDMDISHVTDSILQEPPLLPPRIGFEDRDPPIIPPANDSLQTGKN